MKAMESSQNFPMEGKVDIDETYVGGQDDWQLDEMKARKRSWSLQWREKERAFLACMVVLLKQPARKI